MIQDSTVLMSGALAADGTRNAQAITATTVSTNIIDLRNGLGPALTDEGLSSQDLWLVVQTSQAFNNLTSLTITLESDVASSLAVAPVVHYGLTLPLAALTANTQIARFQLPAADYRRYLGVRYTVSGTAPTTGSVYAFLTPNLQRNASYAGSFAMDV